MSASDLDRELAALADMSGKDVRARWASLTRCPVPKVSPSLLRLALAWELQSRVHGGLSRRTSHQLDQLGAGVTRTDNVNAGMRLVREWNGTIHVVTVDETGTLIWNGATWNSLSEIARAITGTCRSGQAFFGLQRTEDAA